MINDLKAIKRETKTSRELNSLREKGFVPAILYGGKSPNVKISIEEKLLKDFVRTDTPILTVHDSFIVPIGQEDRLDNLMKEDFKDVPLCRT